LQGFLQLLKRFHQGGIDPSMREKFNTIKELEKRAKQLQGKNRLALVGSVDFTGANNPMRGSMNSKHKTQHLCIDNPEFPMFYDGKEEILADYSSAHKLTDDHRWVVFAHIRKYENILRGHTYNGLCFLYCKELDAYKVIERKEVENLTESFGFMYNNEYLDGLVEGDVIPPHSMLTASTSYDEYGNGSIGVNGRIVYGVHPAVQDDAIIISKSFAKRMVTNNVKSITIPINTDTVLLNLYGKDGEYQGLPNIGDHISSGIVCATRTIKESRMFSDMRDSSLRHLNAQSDVCYYGEGEVVDINVYCNNVKINRNKTNAQLLDYYKDARWFYTKVYKVCKRIIDSGSKHINREINRWMRLAMNYLDTQAIWAFNDNVFNNLMVEILIRNKEELNIGRKIVGRAGTTAIMALGKLG